MAPHWLNADVFRAHILDQIHDSVVATDLDGFILSWNTGAERLHGFRADEAVGRHSSIVYAAEERASLHERRVAPLLTKGYHELEAIACTKAGRRHPIHVRLSLIRDATGAPVGIVSIAIDTTELQQARATAFQAERQLRVILDAIPVLVARIDQQQRHLFTNRAYDEFVGRARDELEGRHIREALPNRYEEVQPFVQEALAGRPVLTERVVRTDAGHLEHLVAQLIPDRATDGQVQGFFLLVQRITELKRAEQERLQHERDLRDALVSEVHHRVKNSLQGVVGLLQAQAADHPELSAAMNAAIGQLLTIAVSFGLVSTRGRRGMVLCDMVVQIAQNLQELMRVPVRVSIDENARREPVEIDASRAVNVSLVIYELMLNAVKHGPGPAGSEPIDVAVSRDASMARIRVFNPGGRLPARFDVNAGEGVGTGLRLARVLLPPNGATLAIVQRDDGVEASLTLQLAELGSGDGMHTPRGVPEAAR